MAQADAPVPGDWRAVLDDDAQQLEDDGVLLGGSPLRLLRLSDAGAEIVEHLAAGRTIRESGALDSSKRIRFLRSLLGDGIIHPRPAVGGISSELVTVVVPARDRARGVSQVVGAVGHVKEVLVIDDGSTDDTGAAAMAAGARVIRRPSPGGPAAARNEGLRLVSTPLVAFVDSDCVPAAGWLAPILEHFDDPLCALVAPRILGRVGPEQSTLARYEAAHGALDLGPREGPVVPGSRISYVPSAAIVVRTEAARAIGGFDEKMLVGEDVDFVWRLLEQGWVARYEPRSTVLHEPRQTLSALLRRRMEYGTSAAPLSVRHPDAVWAARMSPWSLAAWVSAVGVSVTGGAMIAAGSVARLAATLRDRVRSPGQAALRLAGRGHLGAGRILAEAAIRTWFPVLLVASMANRRVGRALAASVVVPPLVEWLERRPPLDPGTYSALRTLDNLAYCAGVWRGCVAERTIRPLLPRLWVRSTRSRTADATN